MKRKGSMRGDATVAVGILSLAGCLGFLCCGESLRAEPRRLTGRPPLVQVVTLESTSIQKVPQRFNGIVVAQRQTELSAKMLGRIEQIFVKVGDHVLQDAVLARLDQKQLKAAYELSQAELERQQTILDELTRGPRPQEIKRAAAQVNELEALAHFRRNTWQRYSKSKRGVISEEELDSAQFGLQAAEAKLDMAKLQLDELQEGNRSERIKAQHAVVSSCRAQLSQFAAQLAEATIKAPFNGTIQARFVDEGSVVAPSQKILQIVETDQLELRVGLPASVAASIETQSQAIACVAGRRFDVQLTRVAPALDNQSGTRQAVFELTEDTGSHDFSPGDPADVWIDTLRDESGWWVPTHALTSSTQGLWAVLVAVACGGSSATENSDYQIERRPVELLRTSGGMSQVQGLLNDGDRVVADGIHRVVPGQKVRIDLPDASTSVK